MRTADLYQPTHTELRRAVKEYLGYHGAYALSIMAGIGQERGSPDLSCCVRGRFVAVELKVKRDRQRVEQAAHQYRIEQAGGIYILARTVDDIERRLVAEGLVVPSLV